MSIFDGEARAQREELLGARRAEERRLQEHGQAHKADVERLVIESTLAVVKRAFSEGRHRAYFDLAPVAWEPAIERWGQAAAIAADRQVILDGIAAGIAPYKMSKGRHGGWYVNFE